MLSAIESDLHLERRDRYMTERKLIRLLEPLYEKYSRKEPIESEITVNGISLQLDESTKKYTVNECAEKKIDICVEEESELPYQNNYLGDNSSEVEHDIELRFPGIWKWEGFADDKKLGWKILVTVNVSYETEIGLDKIFAFMDNDFSCGVQIFDVQEPAQKITTLRMQDWLDLTSILPHLFCQLPRRRNEDLFDSVQTKLKEKFLTQLFVATFKTLKKPNDEEKIEYKDVSVKVTECELFIHFMDFQIQFSDEKLYANCMIYLEPDTINVKDCYEETKIWEVRNDSLEEVAFYNACKILWEE